MYIPQAKDIYCYDVNSLYPYLILNNIYWIGDVDVSTKRDLIHPYLQIHYKTNNGLRTISPIGNWFMKLHSPEYENAIKEYKYR